MLKSEDIAITSCRTSYYDPKYMLETKNEFKATQFLVRENWDLFSAPTRSDRQWAKNGKIVEQTKW